MKCTKKTLCNNLKCELCLERSFKNHPKAKFWHKDNKLSPREVFMFTNKNYKFTCDKCHHIFETSPNCICRGCWCIYCANHKLCDDENCQDCFNRSFASHPKSKFWHKDNELKPREVSKNSDKKYKFNCDKCHHYFESSVNNVCYNRWCPYCINKLCDDENCQDCFNKSFASNLKAIYWHSSNELKPREVSNFSHNKYKFNCDKCSHIFECSINGVTQNIWCPYCAHQLLCNDEDCQDCFNKSFASNPKEIYWHSSNKLKPREVFNFSKNKYKFNCDKCHHVFIYQLRTVSNGSWCQYCAGKKLCDEQNCNDCFNRSFASHPKSKFWHVDNKLKPREVFRNCYKKYKFNCDKCHVFESSPNSITNIKSWCPKCVYKTEKKLLEYLKNTFDSVESEFKLEGCINMETDRYLPYDFYLSNLNIIIELDGQHHFKSVEYWGGDEKFLKTKKHDLFKMGYALLENISIIRIYQPDVLSDKIDWRKQLLENIENCKKEPGLFFIGSNNIYDTF